MSRDLLDVLRESFGLKLLISVVAVIVVVLTAYTGFAVIRESAKAKTSLKEQGEMIAGLLAHASVVGIFSEDRNMLHDAAEGVMAQQDVLSASAYNRKGTLLYAVGRDGAGTPPRDAVIDGGAAGITETENAFAVVRPVYSGTVPRSDELLYFGPRTGAPGGPGRVIGYVRVTLSKESYKKEIAGLVERNVVMMLVFILASGAVVSLAVRRVTRPLGKLTRSVKALEQGLPVEPVAVETSDEIGKLAAAFNAMVAARAQAEEEVRQYHERLVALSSELGRSEERERRRIADYIHDSISQVLAVAKLKLGMLREKTTLSAHIDAIDEIRAQLNDCIRYSRSLSVDLVPPALYVIGLDAGIETLADQLAKQHDVKISVETTEEAIKGLSDDMRALLYQMVRELLMNVVKHAEARTATVSIGGDAEWIDILVEDDGKGFDASRTDAQPGEKSGFGLFRIRERLSYIGGRFAVDSGPQGGTRVFLVAPRKLRSYVQEGV